MRKTISPFLVTLVLLASVVPHATHAATHSGSTVVDREGWIVSKTTLGFDALIEKLEAAISEENMGLVTAPSASAGAAGRGIDIPGNRVVGVYRNDFAVRMLEASIAAGIEAPIRFYVTENADKTATLSYKTPSHVFGPYIEEGGQPLMELAVELDGIFANIHNRALGK